uniref:Gustatory receptor n=1 Tax=Elaeophora elaphi TaxID=1147741 RepID=A0A0R3RQ32_9BILA
MPFLKIDFSTRDSTNHIHKHLRAQFVRYFWPVQLILVLLCCRITCLRQKNRRYRWITECHTIFITLFLIIILLITITQFWYGIRTTSVNPLEVAISILQLQGVLNLCFLIYWDRSSVGDKLRQRLQATSTGIGVLRRKTLLDNIHLGAVIFGTFITVFMITYKILRVIANNYSPIMKIPHDLNFNLPHDFHWLFVGIFVYVAFSYPAIYAEVYSLISIICAEYRALNDDFANDCNTYQLPVIRHYVTAHWTMSRSHALFGRSLSLWMSFHLSTSTLSCIYLLRSVPSLIDQLLALEPIIVAALVCTLLLIAIVISQIISSLVICLLLCHDMTHFRYLLIVLIAGTSALQEQTYSVAIAYINHLYRSRVGISFFEITIVDRRFIEKAVTVVLLVTAIYYFNDYDKYSSDGCSKIVPGLQDAT